MLAVAVQLPVVALADDASGTAAIARIAQIADAATLVLTTTPLSSRRRTRRAYAVELRIPLQDP
jgi:hypothetical protein